MQPEEINTLAAIAQAVLAFAALISSITLSILVYVGTKQIARLEYDKTIREWWNTLNQAALSSDEMLLTADKLLNPASDTLTLEQKRRRSFAYMILNALAGSYVGANRGLMASPEDSIATVKHHLHTLLVSDDIFELTQAGYEAEFSEVCREIRLELTKESRKKPQLQVERPQHKT